MKRKLDLNGPGSKLAAWAGLLLIGLPAALILLRILAEKAGVGMGLLNVLLGASLAAGGLLLGILIALLIVEAVQDRNYDAWYRKNRARRVSAPGGLYECQYCGCRQVKPFDRQCPACGRELSE